MLCKVRSVLKLNSRLSMGVAQQASTFSCALQLWCVSGTQSAFARLKSEPALFHPKRATHLLRGIHALHGVQTTLLEMEVCKVEWRIE